MAKNIFNAFFDGLKHVSRRNCNKEDQRQRAQLSEKQIDQTIAASMDASDPPSTY